MSTGIFFLVMGFQICGHMLKTEKQPTLNSFLGECTMDKQNKDERLTYPESGENNDYEDFGAA